MDNTTYHYNLQLIDLQLPQIIAFMLIHYFRGLSTRISDLLAEITRQNPLSLSNTDLYRAKIEDFLVSSALGMVPTQEWNRLHSADGGMMIVKENRENELQNMHVNKIIANIVNVFFKTDSPFVKIELYKFNLKKSFHFSTNIFLVSEKFSVSIL